jgi:hypothetical protein
MTSWVEAIENQYLNVHAHSAMIESLIELTCLREKRYRSNRDVTFAILALRSGNPDLTPDRIGLHTEKNYIGNIRSICHGDNRAAIVSS